MDSTQFILVPYTFKHILRIGLLLFLLPNYIFSQKIENLKTEALGDNIVITYDIQGGDPGDFFNITIYSSHNNFNSPITKVSGDVGVNLKEGKGKRIQWEAKSELGNYKGSLTIEIEVKVVAPLSLKTQLAHVKRGKAIQLVWRGGDQNQKIKIELLKDGNVEGTIGTIANSGAYTWSVPAKQKTGKDYMLRLNGGKETTTSLAFAVHPKVPGWIKFGIPVALGIVAVLFIPKSSEGSETPSKLIGPPDILN